MAKTTIKKSTKTNISKASEKKSPAKKETTKGNTKTKLVTPKKSVTKKLVSVDESTKKKSPKPSIKLTKSELPEVITPQEPNYDECKFTVVSPELGFIKLEGEIPFAVKLQAGVNIVKKDAMRYEFRAKDHNGNDIGTIFDCIDQEESDQFMKELIEFTKSGDVTFAPISKNEGEVEASNEVKPETESISVVEEFESITPVSAETKNLDEFKDKAIKAEDMNSLIESMKANGVTAPPAPIQNNMPVANNPSDPAVLNQNGNTINPVNYNAAVPPSIHTFSKEKKFDELVKYGKSIQETVDSTFQARMQGGLPMSDFMATINQCSKNYNYKVENDGNGYYLIITFEEFQVRVPENEGEFLKVK